MKNQSVIKLISTHRLDPEKGRDLIIERLHKELKTQNSKFKIEYDIYWDGSMRKQVEELAKLYPDNIRYHWYVSLKVILSKPMEYDFVLMPSRFLETFGLSALDFAQFGIPTIGYKKGGVAQFISDYLNISNYPWASEQEQFDNAMETILNKVEEGKKREKKGEKGIDAEKIRENYSKEQRLQRFEEIIW